jgi:photosystem II stability/assembly factor-like uncharacterized protein
MEGPAFGGITKTDSALYVASSFHFYKSIDDGETWTSLDEGVPKVLEYPSFSQRRFDGIDQIIEVGVYDPLPPHYTGGFYVLSPEAAAWQFFDFSSVHRLYSRTTLRIGQDTFIAQLPNEYEVGNYDTAALFFSSNHGLSWEKRTPKHPDSLTSVSLQAYHSRGRIFTVARISGSYRLYQSDNFGTTWQENGLQQLLDTGWSASLEVVVPSFIMVKASKGSEKPVYYSSIDNGETWTLVIGYEEPLNGGHLTYALENRVIIAIFGQSFDSGYSSIISSDSGRTWTQVQTIDGERILWIAQRKTGAPYLAMLKKGRVVSYANLDNNFQKVGAPAFRGLEHPVLSLMHVNGHSLYAENLSKRTFPPYLTDSILISHDEGNTWQGHKLTGGFKLDGSAWFVGRSYVYTIAELENYEEVLIRSSDHGMNWEVVMPDSISSNWTQVFDQTGDTIVIVTNHGSFFSLDGGTVWTRMFISDGGFHRGTCTVYTSSIPHTTK